MVVEALACGGEAVIENILTGLRIGAIILWAWLGIRVIFESWGITKQTPETRHEAWKYWRGMLLVMAFVIVFLFSPENILRANGYIEETTGFYMMAAGVVGLHVCAYLVMVGLDIATGHRNRAWPVYVALSFVSLIYGVTAHEYP